MLSWRVFMFVSLIYTYRITRYLRSETMFSSSFVSVTLAQSQNYPNSKQNKRITLYNLQSIFVNVISFTFYNNPEVKLLLSPFCKWDIPSSSRSSWYSVVNLGLEQLLTDSSAGLFPLLQCWHIRDQLQCIYSHFSCNLPSVWTLFTLQISAGSMKEDWGQTIFTTSFFFPFSTCPLIFGVFSFNFSPINLFQIYMQQNFMVCNIMIFWYLFIYLENLFLDFVFQLLRVFFYWGIIDI